LYRFEQSGARETPELTQTLLHGETRMRRDPAATASGGGSASNLWLFVRIAEFERRRTRKGATKITLSASLLRLLLYDGIDAAQFRFCRKPNP